MITTIFVLSKAKKQLEKSPPQIRTKFKLWVSSVENHGLQAVRKGLVGMMSR